MRERARQQLTNLTACCVAPSRTDGTRSGAFWPGTQLARSGAPGCLQAASSVLRATQHLFIAQCQVLQALTDLYSVKHGGAIALEHAEERRVSESRP